MAAFQSGQLRILKLNPKGNDEKNKEKYFMMDYRQFSAYIEENIEGYLKNLQADCIQVLSEVKNNGILVDTLVIHLKDHPLSPVIPVRPYYDAYKRGMKIGKIMEKIAADFLAGLYQPYTVPFGHLTDFESVKDDIFIRAVNYERNRLILSSCPHVKKLDLALTFRVRFFQGSEGLSSVLVDDRLLAQWDITESALYEFAMRNTMAKFPPVIESSEDIYREMLEQGDGHFYDDSEHMPLYVLTNNIHLNGATAAFYPGVLRDFSESLCTGGMDFYLLPSSIHEMMIVPLADEVQEAGDYQKIVKAVNKEVVSPEEVLSDNVYMYTYRQDEISISTGQTI